MILPERSCPSHSDGPNRQADRRCSPVARNVPESRPGPRLRDPHADPGIHVPVPQDRAARFRHALPRLRPGPAVRGAEEPQALHLVVPQRGALPRGGRERDPRRPGEGDHAALHAAHREVLRARRHLHDGRRRASQARLETARANRARRLSRATQHAPGRKSMKRFAAVLALLAAAGFACAADDKPSIESFFKQSQYGAMVISPDGRHIAALIPVNGRQNVAVLDMEKRAATPVTSFDSRDVISVRWLNSKRLLLQTGSLGTRDFDARGGGLYAVDRDGSEGRLLGEGSDEQLVGGLRGVFRPISLVRTLPGETDDFIAQEFVFDAARRADPGALFRIDSRTGRRTVLSGG